VAAAATGRGAGCYSLAALEDRARSRSTPAGLAPVGATPEHTGQAEGAAREAWERGDHHAVIAILMKAYGGALFAYCRSMLGREGHPDDVLQMVFLQAYAALARFERRSTFRSWLFGIARHRCLDELRQARRWARRLRLWRSAGEDPPASAPEPPTPDARRQDALEACLQELPDQTRDLVLLRFRHELAYDAIGTLTGLPAGTLRVRLYRALSALRGCLERRGVPP
jgi:RNA polymerase sigma-70 factor (ECF subfamily)